MRKKKLRIKMASDVVVSAINNLTVTDVIHSKISGRLTLIYEFLTIRRTSSCHDIFIFLNLLFFFILFQFH